MDHTKLPTAGACRCGDKEVGKCARQRYRRQGVRLFILDRVSLMDTKLNVRGTGAGAGEGAAQCSAEGRKEGHLSLGWTSGGDQGGSNGADSPVSCRSQGAG